MLYKHTLQQPPVSSIYLIWHRNNKSQCSTVIGIYYNKELAERNHLKLKKANKHEHCQITITEESVYEY
jgi:hypothetical protein